MKNLNKNFFALSMVLCLGITTQAWGGVDNGPNKTEGTCGTGCTWNYSDGTLTITGTGTTKADASKSDSWAKVSNMKDSVRNVVISGIKELSSNAFKEYSLESFDVDDNNLQIIGENAFNGCTNLKSIVIPDSVTSIKKQAFLGSGLETIVVPDGISSVNKDAFKGLNEGTAIICQGSGNNGCHDYGKYSSSVNYFDTTNSTIKPASELQCYGDKHYWNGTNCVNEPNKANRTCSSSYKMNDGLCDRIRYTPAEAAKVVTDDNNNSVTITFKK